MILKARLRLTSKISKMCNNQCIMKYLVNFNHLAAHVQWGDATLHQQLYCGLPSCIKDEITHISKPDTLHKLCSLTQSIDSQYWECCSKVARKNLTTNKNECFNNKGKGKKKSNTTQNANKNKNNNGRKSNSGNSGNANTGSSNDNQKKPNSDLSSKLGKDGKLMQAEKQHHFKQNPSGDNLFSTLKLSWSSANSDLGHLWHFSDSNCLPVLEMLQRTSYSESLPAVPNATMHSFHSNPLPDTSSEGNLETSSDSTPSDPKSGPMFFRNPPSRSGDRATPMASDIKGRVIKVICDVKGQWWSGSMGNARRWP